MDIDEFRRTISYPTSWTYKLIGREEAQVRAAVASLLSGRSFEIEKSHESTTGKWRSLTLTLMVQSEEDRLGLFDALKSLESIHFVL